jgi:hypothetical protein
MGDDLTLAMFPWSSGHPKAECEVQLYAIEFNVLVAQCKNYVLCGEKENTVLGSSD